MSPMSHSAPGPIITVVKPQAGAQVSIASEAGAKLALEFNASDATVSRSDNDLVFDLGDGSRVTLSDFFVVGDQALPSLIFSDDAEIAASDYLSSFDINLETAAGPGAGTGAAGSGAGEYADDPGSLIDGIGRLGSLGTIYWDQATEVPELNIRESSADIASAAGLTPPGSTMPALDGVELTVHEDALAGGTDAGSGRNSDTVSLGLPLGVTAENGIYDLIAGGQKVGEVTVVNGEVSYTLDASKLIHTGDGKDTEVLGTAGIQVKDANGNTAIVTVTVNVVDDAPALTIGEDPESSIKGGRTEEGYLQLAEGADGIDWKTFTINGEKVVWDSSSNSGLATVDNGVFELSHNPATGELAYTFTANVDASLGETTYTFSMKDNDGDPTEATIGINIALIQGEVTVDESYIAGGTVTEGYVDLQDDPGTASQAGSFEVSVADLSSLTVWASITDGGVPDLVAVKNNLTVYTEYGKMKFSVNSSTGEVTYTYTLTKNYSGNLHDDNSPDTGRDETAHGAENISIQINGKDVGSITVNIEDDAPVISIDGSDSSSFLLGKLGEDATNLVFTAEGVIDRTYGADNAKGSAGEDAAKAEYITIEHTTYSAEYGEIGPNTYTLTTDGFVDGRCVVSLGGRGELVLTITDNGIAYTYIAKFGDVGDKEKLTIGVADSDGDSASVDLDIELNYPVPAGTALVDEAGLDNIGSHHAGWYASETTFSVMLDEGAVSIQWDLANMPENVKADVSGDGNYTQVEWVAEDGVLYGKVGDTTVIAVTPNTTTHGSGTTVLDGTMAVSLEYPIQHGEAGSSTDASLGLLLPYTPIVADENGTESDGIPNQIHVTVKDDYPVAVADVEILVEPDTASYNVYLVLDNSGSMYQDINTGTWNSDNTRMAAAIDAMTELVKAYVAAGSEVRFTMLEFSSDNYAGNVGLVAVGGSTSLTAEQLLTYLENHAIQASTTTGGTDYGQLSLIETQITADLTNTEYQGWENKVYFISDGKPANGATPDTWQETMDTYGVDIIAVGVDVGNDSAAQTALEGVANSGDTVINVSLSEGDYGALTDALLGTLETTVSGNLLVNDTASADGMTLEYITFNGSKYAFTEKGGTSTEAIDLGNGVTITVDKDGNYTLVAKANVTDGVSTTGLSYTVKDADGDYRTADITITLQDASPVAYDNAPTAVELTQTALYSSLTSGSDWDAAGTVKWGENPLNSNELQAIPGTGSLGNPLNPDNKGALLTANTSSTNLANLVVDSSNSDLDTVAKVAADAGVKGDIGTAAVISSGNSIVVGDGGVITFNWQFANGRSGNSGNYDKDAAFWVLKDANGNIVDTGLVIQGGNSQHQSGVTNIPVTEGGTYTLVIVVVNDADGKNGDAKLFVDDIVTSYNVPYFEGNILNEPSPAGQMDSLVDGAYLKSITYNGKEHTFSGAADCKEIVTDKGALVIYGSGAYTFTGNHLGSSIDDINFLYTLRDQDGDESSAWLYIRTDEYNITGTDGEDILHGTGGNDVISGGAGNDVIYGGTGDDAIYGGTGDDRIFGEGGNDTIWGGNGNDVLFGDNAPVGSKAWTNTEWDAALADYLATPENPSTLGGQAIKAAAESTEGGNDTIYGEAGNDVIFGQGGNDTIYGGDGDDFIHGGAGDDFIYGGRGNDVMHGGEGKDVFAWTRDDLDGSRDQIMDFHYGETGDKLRFDSLFQEGSGSLGIEALLANHILAAGVVDDRLVLTVTQGQATVTVDVNFAGGQPDLSNFNELDTAAQAQILQQMIITSSSG